MIATTTARPVTHTLDPTAGRGVLSVGREDIRFTTAEPGLLVVELTVRNAGDTPTAPTAAVLGSAPLGVFVPWQPLGVVQVPSLGPGESAVVEKQYRYDTPQPLGGVDRLPPDRVLTALGLNEPDRNRRRQRAGAAGPGLAPDLLALLQQGGPHWAGNLNLFFPGADVERHVAQALRVYPGRVNLAMFIIGDPTDEYQYRLTGEATAWNARLYDAVRGRPIVEGVSAPELEEGPWRRPHSGMMLLAVEPPAGAEAGAVNVHVRQRSSGREAVVEFTMDARADGPGCYKL
jgi:hypothetical protein